MLREGGGELNMKDLIKWPPFSARVSPINAINET